MNRSTVSWLLSVALATTVHAAVVGLLMVHWSSEASVDVTPVKPFYIEASVVGKNPLEERNRAQKQQQRLEYERREARREADREEQARLTKQAALKKQQEKQQQESRQRELARLEEQKQDKSRQEQLADEKEKEQNQSDIEQSLVMAAMEEQNMRRAVTDDEKNQAYIARVQYDIIQNWSRPPSARNGMQAVLRVFLVPTGEVTNVVLEESSGNDAFDRSALLAVNKAEQFNVPADSKQFERHFREFTVLFRPEDLRL